MLIQLISEQAEKKLLEALEGVWSRSASRVVLVCSFSKTSLRFTPESALVTLKDVLQDCDGELYFCADGDVAICWRGRINEIKIATIKAILTRYATELEMYDPLKLFHFFDANVQGEDLRLLFRGKINNSKSNLQEKKSEELKASQAIPVKIEQKVVITEAMFSEEQKKYLQAAIARRSNRQKPELLVVEDHDFSRKLLTGLLEQQYPCYAAKDAQQAIQLYAEHAPNITFLDVELPDLDGHSLAALFRKSDSNGHIVMVTGNSYVKDIEAAKANKVHGFIVKPYNKQKIMGVVEAYISAKKG